MGLFSPRDRKGNKHSSWAEAHKANALYDLADHARLEQQRYWASPEGQKHNQEIEKTKEKIFTRLSLFVIGLVVLYYVIQYWVVVLVLGVIGFGLVMYFRANRANAINTVQNTEPAALPKLVLDKKMDSKQRDSMRTEVPSKAGRKRSHPKKLSGRGTSQNAPNTS